MSRRRSPRSIASTALARLGACETQAVLIERLGDRTSPERERLRQRGEVAHAAFHTEATEHHNAELRHLRRGACFVATAVLGPDDVDTNRLRAFRDRVLRPHGWGRRLIAGYYRASPTLATWLRGRPGIARCLAPCLRGVARVVDAFP